MARTIRSVNERLMNAIKRNQQRDQSEHAPLLSSRVARMNRRDAAILRGQDGAIR